MRELVTLIISKLVMRGLVIIIGFVVLILGITFTIKYNLPTYQKPVEILVEKPHLDSQSASIPKTIKSKSIKVESESCSNIYIEEIDSCQYIVYKNSYGDHVIHKGNCKYCIKRNNL